MADPASDVPNFDDFSGALDRVRRATDAGQEPDPGDIDIFRRGNATHGAAYDAAQAQPSPSPAAPPPQPQDQTLLQRGEALIGQSDPNSYFNMGLRGLTNYAGMLADLPANAFNAAKAGYEARGGTNWAGPPIELRPDATPVEREWAAGVQASPMVAPGARVQTPSEVLRSVTGIPAMGKDASTIQQLGESLGPILAGSAPAAVGAWKTATGPIPAKATAAIASYLKNAVLAPAASVGGAAFGEKYGGPLGGFVGGVAAPFVATALPQTINRTSAGLHDWWWRAPEGEGAESQIPTTEVTRAANELGVEPRFGMLARLGGKKTEQALSSLTFTPATWAKEGDKELFTQQANKLIENRRALPDATPDNLGLLIAAQAGRNAEIAQGTHPLEASATPAVEKYIQDRYDAATPNGDPVVEWTATVNALKGMFGGRMPDGSVQQITPQMRNTIGDRVGQLTTLAPQPGETGDGIAKYIIPGPDGPRYFGPMSLVRGWRQGLGMQTQKSIGMQGPQLDQTYASITGDMRNAAAAHGLSPGEFDAAMAIERGEHGADALKEQLLDPTLFNRKAPAAADFGERMQKLYEDPDAFKRMLGGPYVPKEAPTPVGPGGLGPGDIRRQAANLGVIGRSSYVPPEQGGGAQSLFRAARELGWMGAAGQGLGWLTGLPYASGAGAFAGNFLRGAAMGSKTTRDVMMGRGAPWFQAPSGLPSMAAASQQENIRRALGLGGGAGPPEQSTPAPIWRPYSSPQPGVVPKVPYRPYSELPTTQGILAAWNRANVGNPRSMTAP